MPSFFEGLKRVISGQPVFQPGENVDGVVHKSDQQADAQTQPGQTATPTQTGPKVIPEVLIERIEYRNNGAQLDVDIEAKNHSDRNVLIDRINVLGTTRQINMMLRPGEQREIPVYEGQRPNHRNYSNCELRYRDETTGDYFASVHFVEFQQENDQTYVPIRIRFVPPVKDI